MSVSAIIMILVLSVALIAVVKIMEKGLPKLIKRKKAEWEAEARSKEFRKQHEINEDMKIQKVVKEEKQKIFEANRKERNKQMHQNNIAKGKDYEIFIAEIFKNLGYKTQNHGLIHGRNDKGIDVIVMKDKEITLIQCKNWKADSKFKITHEKIKAFIGDTTAFLDNNKEKAKGYTIKRMFVTSNDILDDSARHFLRSNSIVEHVIIPML
ncbi:MAG: restriction endonuclease [Campylobacterales bacterium]|nr:restriction endonuclease [Campylobacterales bacterium]